MWYLSFWMWLICYCHDLQSRPFCCKCQALVLLLELAYILFCLHATFSMYAVINWWASRMTHVFTVANRGAMDCIASHAGFLQEHYQKRNSRVIEQIHL